MIIGHELAENMGLLHNNCQARRNKRLVAAFICPFYSGLERFPAVSSFGLPSGIMVLRAPAQLTREAFLQVLFSRWFYQSKSIAPTLSSQYCRVEAKSRGVHFLLATVIPRVRILLPHDLLSNLRKFLIGAACVSVGPMMGKVEVKQRLCLERSCPS